MREGVAGQALYPAELQSSRLALIVTWSSREGHNLTDIHFFLPYILIRGTRGEKISYILLFWNSASQLCIFVLSFCLESQRILHPWAVYSREISNRREIGKLGKGWSWKRSEEVSSHTSVSPWARLVNVRKEYRVNNLGCDSIKTSLCAVFPKKPVLIQNGSSKETLSWMLSDLWHYLVLLIDWKIKCRIEKEEILFLGF